MATLAEVKKEKKKKEHLKTMFLCKLNDYCCLFGFPVDI